MFRINFINHQNIDFVKLDRTHSKFLKFQLFRIFQKFLKHRVECQKYRLHTKFEPIRTSFSREIAFGIFGESWKTYPIIFQNFYFFRVMTPTEFLKNHLERFQFFRHEPQVVAHNDFWTTLFFGWVFHKTQPKKSIAARTSTSCRGQVHTGSVRKITDLGPDRMTARYELLNSITNHHKIFRPYD